MLGTPCLVTPFSQYVKNAALMNLYSKSMDEKPFTRMDPAMWGMILGKSGKLPGTLAPEIIELAKEKQMEFYTDDPQALYPDVLPQFIAEMEKNGWDRGQDDEELFEFAMHEKQYREYKSGQAKEQFNKDLFERMEKAAQTGQPVKFLTAADKRAILHPNAEPLEATLSGKVMWELDFNEDSKAPALGTFYKQGDVVCYLQTPHGIEPIRAFEHCRVVSIEKEQGATAVKGDALCWVEKADLVEEVVENVKDAAKKVKDAIKEAVKKADTEIIEGNKSNWKMTKNHK
jgi:pyruvate carboxylase subunit B